MDHELHSIIRRHSTPLLPLPTGTSPVLRPMPGIKAVLFDVYGTLLISASGDIGLADSGGRGQAFADALAAVGVNFSGNGSEGVERLVSAIQEDHARLRGQDVAYPEVDIVEIWKTVTSQLFAIELIGSRVSELETLRRLAVEYEVRTNPVWPMPDCEGVLRSLKERGLLLGLVSNAQFFTPELFPAVLNADLDTLGFHEQLRIYSYLHKRAKPGLSLYEAARDALADLNVTPQQTLYIGNDMRNDIRPAARSGFKTALFAGDRRSLRLREDDPETHEVKPDLVLTELTQVLDCLVGT